MDYKSRLLQLKLLPLSMLYELNDICFFVKSLKNPHSSFNILDFVKFSHNSTRSGSTHKLVLPLVKSTRHKNLYFCRPGFHTEPWERGDFPPLTSVSPPQESWPRKLISLTESVLVCRRFQITLRGLKISKFFWGSMPPDPPRMLWPMAAADQLSCTQMFPPLQKNSVWNPANGLAWKQPMACLPP